MNYYTVKEFAARFGQDEAVIRKLIKEEVIKAIRIGEGEYKIDSRVADDIEASGMFD